MIIRLDLESLEAIVKRILEIKRTLKEETLLISCQNLLTLTCLLKGKGIISAIYLIEGNPIIKRSKAK